MDLNIYIQKDYENKLNWTLGENKPNSNPIKPNSRKAKMNVSSLITKDYRKKDDFEVQKTKPKQTQFPKSQKMNTNAFLQKDYENETAFRPQKNKPKQTQFPGPQRVKTEFPCRMSEVRYLSSAFCALSSAFRPLFPDKAGFSFDFVARPLIINANIRQLHLPMKSEQFEQFKARKEKYHVY